MKSIRIYRNLVPLGTPASHMLSRQRGHHLDLSGCFRRAKAKFLTQPIHQLPDCQSKALRTVAFLRQRGVQGLIEAA